MPYTNAYLEHHGILGQKWGIRRFQNPDGTYTEAGRKRRNAYGKVATNLVLGPVGAAAFYKTKDYVKNKREEHKSVDLSTMTDSELRSVVNRMNMEQRYSELYLANVNQGRKHVNEVLDRVGNIINISGTVAQKGSQVNAMKNGTDPISDKKLKKMKSDPNTFVGTLKAINNLPRKNDKIDFTNMSDDELRKALDRLSLEKQYKDLNNKNKTKKASEYATIAIDLGTSAVGIAYMISKIMK